MVCWQDTRDELRGVTRVPDAHRDELTTAMTEAKAAATKAPGS
jgi:hypothetical protein